LSLLILAAGGVISCGGSGSSAAAPPPSQPTTYTISGTAGQPGVTLAYTDGSAKTVVSASNGAYTLTVPSGWSGTVTPSLTGYSFSPANRSYTALSSNQTTGQDYTATRLTYAISGNAGSAGVTLSYNDGAPRTVTSAANGSYTFTVPHGWSGTVTPAKPGHAFTPASRSYTSVTSPQTSGQDYVAALISLQVSGYAGTPGATLTYVDGTPRQVVADAQGNFSFLVPYGWSGTVTPSKVGYAPNLQACTFQPASYTLPALTGHLTNVVFSATPIRRFGVVVFAGGWIGIVDPATQTLTTHLVGEAILDPSNSTFDPVLTPDGQKVLVSGFANDLVHIIDIRDLQAPRLMASVNVGFFAEDIDVTPDGRFAVVSNGGFSSKLAIVDLNEHRLVDVHDFPTDPNRPMYCANAISPDGRTVLGVDYFTGVVNVLTLNTEGRLTYVKTLQFPRNGSAALLRPVNITFAPDGRTAIAAVCLSSYDAHSNLIYGDMAWPILRIDGPGEVVISGYVKPPLDVSAGQSVVFAPDGTRAYISAVRSSQDPSYPRQVVDVLNITGPGMAVSAGRYFAADFVGTSQLFGVDTLAIEPSGRHLYMSNMTLSGATERLQVIDTQTGQVIKNLDTPPVQLSWQFNQEIRQSLPTGITFTKQ